jgi:chromosome partitioning protein
MAATITTIAMKGGVGKTTTTVNTAAALASMGYRCLIVDLDGNGSATASLDQQIQAEESTSWALLTGKARLPLAIEPGLDLFSGDSRLFQADMTLGQVIGRERLLERALARFQAEYDFIWLDCPPAWNLLTINSMVSADYYLVPVQAQHLALEALRELVGGVHRIEEGMGRIPKCLGFLLTMVDHRVKSTADILQDVKATLKADVLPISIPMNNDLAQAPKFGSHIFAYNARCKGARAYKQFAAVVLKKVNFKKPKSVKEA